MESLSREDNVRDILESLHKLPEDLDTIYDEALQRIKRQDRQKVVRADQVLTLINCAYRPLRIQEIQHALSIRPSDTFTDLEALPRVESLLSACCGLVVVEDESQVVRLVHYTTEVYFNRKNQYRSSAAHLNIAGTLITYLNFTTFATPPPTKPRLDAKGRPLSDGEIQTDIVIVERARHGNFFQMMRNRVSDICSRQASYYSMLRNIGATMHGRPLQQ